MVDEMEASDKNEVWDLMELLVGRNHMIRKWVFRKNLITKGKVEKYKSQWVEKYYSYVKGIDFGEILLSYFQVK